jgi:BirA family transcriptional regulator, biotin operon repressor / biotin---[acetyl-CoA-carboxylase] ligase
VDTPIRFAACDTVGSTNSEALARAREGDPGPLWVTARAQTAGRGRRGRIWISPPGNFYGTLLLVDSSPAALAPQLSFVAALAVREALAQLGRNPAPISLKWPNDVVWNGAKIAGVLIEGEGNPLAVAIGIGVNCVHHPRDVAFPATDLLAQGVEASAEQVLPVLAGTMTRRLMRWDRGAGFASIRADWLAHAHALGSPLSVRTSERQLDGRFDGMDDVGRLRLRLADGSIELITAGDVLPAASHADATAAT